MVVVVPVVETAAPVAERRLAEIGQRVGMPVFKSGERFEDGFSEVICGNLRQRERAEQHAPEA